MGVIIVFKLFEDLNVSVLVIEWGLINDNWMFCVFFISSDYISDSFLVIMDYRSCVFVSCGGF